ncbi:MAG: DUF711 family protein [Chloroflexota bacterium]
MEIRSVTLFSDPELPAPSVSGFLVAARTQFPVRVQSLRLGTRPFPNWLPRESAVTAAMEFVAAWQTAGIDYVSLGPVGLDDDVSWLDLIPDLIGTTGTTFASVTIAGEDGRLSLERCRAMARCIRQVSTIYPDGFGNLFMGGLAAVGPGHPFLPATYHSGGPAHFAIAVESGDLALSAVHAATTLDEARANLIAAIESAAAEIAPVAEALSREFGVAFSGLDFSLAPYPTPEQSLAGAMEALGVPHLGAPGGLFAAAFITEAIDRAQFPRTGFSGLMLPVLEDAVLARRAAEGHISLNDLLVYSAVCGVGLDTIPLPGDISEAALTGILLDVAALASRLRKPLVARLMPLPGLSAGDPTAFDFEYFAPSRVLDVPGGGVDGLLLGQSFLDLQRYRSR